MAKSPQLLVPETEHLKLNLKDGIITQYGYLFWWVKEKDKLSEEAIVEAILHYGNESAIKDLFNWLGVMQVANIFRNQLKHSRVNYPARTQHFFTLYFDRHAPEYSEPGSN